MGLRGTGLSAGSTCPVPSQLDGGGGLGGAGGRPAALPAPLPLVLAGAPAGPLGAATGTPRTGNPLGALLACASLSSFFEHVIIGQRT